MHDTSKTPTVFKLSGHQSLKQSAISLTYVVKKMQLNLKQIIVFDQLGNGYEILGNGNYILIKNRSMFINKLLTKLTEMHAIRYFVRGMSPS